MLVDKIEAIGNNDAVTVSVRRQGDDIDQTDSYYIVDDAVIVTAGRCACAVVAERQEDDGTWSQLLILRGIVHAEDCLSLGLSDEG